MANIDELKNLLEQDIEQLTTLSALLEQEKSLLSGADVQSLAAVTHEKNHCLGQIRERAKAKIRLLVAMGFRPDQGEPSRFLRSAGMHELVSLWQKASDQLIHCQTLNRANSCVVSHLQKRLARLTEIFRGATGQAKLYGAKGQEEAVSHRNVLASA